VNAGSDPITAILSDLSLLSHPEGDDCQYVGSPLLTARVGHSNPFEQKTLLVLLKLRFSNQYNQWPQILTEMRCRSSGLTDRLSLN